MSRPPRIVAADRVDWIEDAPMDRSAVVRTPGVEVEVTFDLGDHQYALALLDQVTANVRRQIADAAEGQR
jgi:hypothetical protein